MSRILFASIPFDGHFNPLSSLAVHLRDRGHDVRWYTGGSYAARLERLGIPHFPFVRAREVTTDNIAQLFPEYEKLGMSRKGMELATREIFYGPIESQYRDVAAIHASFPFDALVCDAALFVSRVVAEKLGPRVYVVSAAPTPAPTSKTAPPPFFGLKPARTALGGARDAILRLLLERGARSGMDLFNDFRAREGLPPYRGSGFDMHVDTADAYFQIGVPGLDFPRADWPANFQFVGALMPSPSARASGLSAALEEKLARYGGRCVLVSQGTTDNRDTRKLFGPALDALAGSEHLVVVTTGGKVTAELRHRYPQDNVVIEDWIDFNALLPRTKLFLCNGGFGSILLALSHGVRVVTAGKLEGKADINARLDYRGVALDLRTEHPTAAQARRAVARVLADPRYAANVERARAELAQYRPLEIIERRLHADGIVASVAPLVPLVPLASAG